MNISRRKISFAIAALITTAIALFATTQRAYLAPLLVQGESDIFRYSAQGTRDGGLYITVSPYFEDAKAMRRYRQINAKRGMALDAQTSIPVVITLTKPISQPDARLLMEKAHIRVDSFLLVGHSNLNTTRGTYIQFGSLDKQVALEQNMDPMGKNEKLILSGVMVIKGESANSEGLVRLLGDNRVYLVDTSEFQVRELLRQRHNAITAGKTLYINVPSPYWDLEW